MFQWENNLDTKKGRARDLAEPKSSNDVDADVVVAAGAVQYM